MMNLHYAIDEFAIRTPPTFTRVQVIISEPSGGPGRALRRLRWTPGVDGRWRGNGPVTGVSPRRLTIFIAPHDVRHEVMGPTRLWPETHAPRGFPEDGAVAATDRGKRRAAALPPG